MRTVQASDQWFTDSEIVRKIIQTWAARISSKPVVTDWRVFDPSTNKIALEMHNRKLNGFSELYSYADEATDFLSLDNKFKIDPTNLLLLSSKGVPSPISFQNPPYSKAVGGAGPFVSKHLEVCDYNDLVSVQLVNSVIGAKWFHEILQGIKDSSRQCAIGFINPRISFYTCGKRIEKTKADGTIQETFWSIQDYEREGFPFDPDKHTTYYKIGNIYKELELITKKGKQPRYDNMIIMTMPSSYKEPSWKFNSLLDTLNLDQTGYSIKWFAQI